MKELKINPQCQKLIKIFDKLEKLVFLIIYIYQAMNQSEFLAISSPQDQISYPNLSPSDLDPLAPELSFGQWNQKEILKYYLFIHHHKQKFESKSSRKSLKVFKQMARFIKSRNSSQCRTHHQNILSKQVTLENCLANYIEKNINFQKSYGVAKEKLNYLEDLDFCEHATDEPFQCPKLLEDHRKELEKEKGAKLENVPTSNSLHYFPTATGYEETSSKKDLKLQIIECHFFFLAWLSKLHKIIDNS